MYLFIREIPVAVIFFSPVIRLYSNNNNKIRRAV